MDRHRRKWGWWLVAALAVALAASFLFRKCPDKPSGPGNASAGDADSASVVVSDTVSADVADGGTARESTISIPMKDITGFIRNKSGRDISLTTSAPDRISVSYSGKVVIPLLGEQEMDLSADFKVVEVQGDRLVMQMDSGAAKNAVAGLFSSVIMDRLPAGLVESFSGGRAVVNLSAVPPLKKRLKDVDLVGFAVDEDGISLTTVPRP